MNMNQQQLSYTCPKCGNTEFETDEIHTTGGAFSKIFDVQNKKFVAVTCTRCKYTELYKSTTTALGNILDFLTRR
jgi:hypothetical protein